MFIYESYTSLENKTTNLTNRTTKTELTERLRGCLVYLFSSLNFHFSSLNSQIWWAPHHYNLFGLIFITQYSKNWVWFVETENNFLLLSSYELWIQWHFCKLLQMSGTHSVSCPVNIHPLPTSQQLSIFFLSFSFLFYLSLTSRYLSLFISLCFFISSS